MNIFSDNRGNRGFSIIEMILVIVVFGIIATSAMFLIAQTGNWIMVRNRQADVGNAEYAMLRAIKEIQASRGTTMVLGASSLQFTNTSGSNVALSLSNGNFTLNGDLLLQNVTGLAFDYLDQNGSVTGTASQVRVVRISIATNGRTTVGLRSAALVVN